MIQVPQTHDREPRVRYGYSSWDMCAALVKLFDPTMSVDVSHLRAADQALFPDVILLPLNNPEDLNRTTQSPTPATSNITPNNITPNNITPNNRLSLSSQVVGMYTDLFFKQKAEKERLGEFYRDRMLTGDKNLREKEDLLQAIASIFYKLPKGKRDAAERFLICNLDMENILSCSDPSEEENFKLVDAVNGLLSMVAPTRRAGVMKLLRLPPSLLSHIAAPVLQPGVLTTERVISVSPVAARKTRSDDVGSLSEHFTLPRASYDTTPDNIGPLRKRVRVSNATRDKQPTKRHAEAS